MNTTKEDYKEFLEELKIGSLDIAMSRKGSALYKCMYEYYLRENENVFESRERITNFTVFCDYLYNFYCMPVLVNGQPVKQTINKGINKVITYFKIKYAVI